MSNQKRSGILIKNIELPSILPIKGCSNHPKICTIEGAEQKLLEDAFKDRQEHKVHKTMHQAIAGAGKSCFFFGDSINITIDVIFFNSRGVAQPGSALAWGASGRRFKSCRPDQNKINRPIFWMWSLLAMQ